MNMALTESTNETNAVRRQRTKREAVPLGTTGFDALLAELRPASQPSFDTPVLIESEMFDAPRREGGSRPQPRDDSGSFSDQSDQSRTDVRARRAAVESPTRGMQQADPAPSKSSPPRAAAERAGESLPDHARRHVEPESRSNRAPVAHATRHAPAVPLKESPSVARSDAHQPAATAQRVSAETRVRPVDAANSRTENAARTLGRVLGAPQAAGVEAARGSGAEQGALNQGKTAAGKPTTPSQAPRKQEATRESSFARMVRSLRISPGSRNSSATIRLEPQRLGRMDIHVKLSGDRISIEVRTETTEARELIASRAVELRSALEQHGLRIERFDVRVDLRDAIAADRPLGPKGDDRDDSGSSKRGSRRDAVESSSTAVDRAPIPIEAEVVEGDDAVASAEVAITHRRHVDIRV